MAQRTSTTAAALDRALPTLSGLCLGLDGVQSVDGVDEDARRRYAAELAAAVQSLARLQRLLLDEGGVTEGPAGTGPDG